jgi:hypothetical protein
MKGHTGEKPFSCTLCEYRTAQKSDLTSHMKTHTGEKPYSCTLCKYRTGHKSHLTDHMRTHSGEKPFPCTLCEYRTATKSDLTDHMRRHAGDSRHTRRVHPAAPDTTIPATDESQCVVWRVHVDHPTHADDGAAAAAEEESQCVVCPDPTPTTCMTCGDQCICEDAECIGEFLFLSRKRNDDLCATKL